MIALVRLGRQVIVLEYLRGGQLYDSLHRLAGSEQPYTEQAAAAIFAQVKKVPTRSSTSTKLIAHAKR